MQIIVTGYTLPDVVDDSREKVVENGVLIRMSGILRKRVIWRDERGRERSDMLNEVYITDTEGNCINNYLASLPTSFY